MCSARETTHINHTPTSSRDQPNVNIRSHIRWIQPKTLSTPKTIKTIDHHRSEGPPSRPVRLLRNSARMTPTRTGLLLATAQVAATVLTDLPRLVPRLLGLLALTTLELPPVPLPETKQKKTPIVEPRYHAAAPAQGPHRNV
eukprot:g25936.t1